MGGYLPSPNLQKNKVQGENTEYIYCSLSMQGWSIEMQEAVLMDNLDESNSLFGVFDGHSGFTISKHVSQLFSSMLKQISYYKQKKYQLALQEAFKNIDDYLKTQKSNIQVNDIQSVNYSKQDKERVNYKNFYARSTGTTANIILITPFKYYIANIGDSICVLKTKQSYQIMNRTHIVADKDQIQRVIKAGGYIFNQRVNGAMKITRCFGSLDYKSNQKLEYDEQIITCRPSITYFDRKQGDLFILQADKGVWERQFQRLLQLLEQIANNINTKTLEQIIADIFNKTVAKNIEQKIGLNNMAANLIVFK